MSFLLTPNRKTYTIIRIWFTYSKNVGFVRKSSSKEAVDKKIQQMQLLVEVI